MPSGGGKKVSLFLGCGGGGGEFIRAFTMAAAAAFGCVLVFDFVGGFFGRVFFAAFGLSEYPRIDVCGRRSEGARKKDICGWADGDALFGC